MSGRTPPVAPQPRPVAPVDVLLVCSPGGHLLQLHLLREAWSGMSSAWVTLDKSDARSLLAGEQVYYANGPTARNLRNLVRNALLAWRLTRDLRPRAIVTTGAGIAVPFVVVGRLLRVHVVYVESLARVEHPSLTLRLVAPFANRIYVQWAELRGSVPRARFAGTVLGS